MGSSPTVEKSPRDEAKVEPTRPRQPTQTDGEVTIGAGSGLALSRARLATIIKGAATRQPVSWPGICSGLEALTMATAERVRGKIYDDITQTIGNTP